MNDNCPWCSNATQYPDGRMRCDLEFCDFEPGRFKIWKVAKVEREKVRGKKRATTKKSISSKI